MVDYEKSKFLCKENIFNPDKNLICKVGCVEFLCERNSLYVFKACFLFSAKLPLFLKVNGSLLQTAVAAMAQTNLVTIVFTLR